MITLLILSWLESFLILPSHVAHITNPNKHPKERAWLAALENSYGWVLEKAVNFRWWTVGLSFAMLIAVLCMAKTTMSFQLFPPVGVDEYIVPGDSTSGHQPGKNATESARCR